MWRPTSTRVVAGNQFRPPGGSPRIGVSVVPEPLPEDGVDQQVYEGGDGQHAPDERGTSEPFQ